MFLFYRLLLAHFLGDFVFQTDKVYGTKIKSFSGVIAHGLIILFVSLLLSVPYLVLPQVWIYLLIMTGIHIALDAKRVKIINQGREDNLWMFLGDQAGHIVTLLLVFFVPEVNRIRMLPLEGIGYLYNLTTFINTLTGIIIATYGGSVLIYYLKKTFWDERAAFSHDSGGRLERFLIILCILIIRSRLLYLALVLIVVFRILAYLRNSGHFKPDFDVILRGGKPIVIERTLELKGDILIDLMVSPVIGIITGIILRAL